MDGQVKEQGQGQSQVEAAEGKVVRPPVVALRQRMIGDMQLRNFSERTIESYVRAVGQLSGFCWKSPDQVSDEELREKYRRADVFVLPVRDTTANTRYLHKKYPKAKKFCTIGPDYDFGRREEMAFTEEIKKLVPGAEIVYEAWPKLGEKDFTAFITAIMAKKPDAVHGSLFGGDLVSFTKQAAPYGFFEKTPFIALYDFPVLLALGADAPEGVYGFGRVSFFMDPNPKKMDNV